MRWLQTAVVASMSALLPAVVSADPFDAKRVPMISFRVAGSQIDGGAMAFGIPSVSSGRQLAGCVCSAQLCLLLGVLLMTVPVRGAGSIFDDDAPIPAKPVEPPHPAEVPPATQPLSGPDAINPVTQPTATQPTEAALPTPQPPTLQDIPGKTELAHSRQLLKVAFAEQLKDRTPSARRALADTLIQESDKTSYSPADRAALLTAAIEAAKEGSSLPQCLEAADKLSNAFRVDDLTLKLNAATSMNLRGPGSAGTENIHAGLELAGALSAAEDFADAVRVLGLLRPLAASDPGLRSVVARRSQSLESARAVWEKIRPSLEKLKTSPADTEANLAVGSCYCLHLGRWDKGLPYLARGSNEKLRELAAAELSGATEPAKDLQVADGWWDYAESIGTPAPDANAIKLHAATLYQRSQDAATGLAAKAVETRMKEAADIAAQLGEPAPVLVYTFADQSTMADFNVVGNATILGGGGVQLSHGTPSEIFTKATFRAPIRVEFEAHCLADGILDVMPCILTTGNDHATGLGMSIGTSYNRATALWAFGVRVKLPHTPLKANETYRIVLSVDKDGTAIAEIDGRVVYKAAAPKGAPLEGHIIISGGQGDVVYTKVTIRGSNVAASRP